VGCGGEEWGEGYCVPSAGGGSEDWRGFGYARGLWLGVGIGFFEGLDVCEYVKDVAGDRRAGDYRGYTSRGG